jgi:hypothetical protein
MSLDTTPTPLADFVKGVRTEWHFHAIRAIRYAPRTLHPRVIPWRESGLKFWESPGGLPLPILTAMEVFLGGGWQRKAKDGLHVTIVSFPFGRCYVPPVPEQLSADRRPALPGRLGLSPAAVPETRRRLPDPALGGATGLATGAVLASAFGPWRGKQTGETALFRSHLPLSSFGAVGGGLRQSSRNRPK